MGAAALPIAAGATIAGGAYSAYAQGQAGKASQGYYQYLANNAKINAGLARAAGEANIREIGEQANFEEQKIARNTREVVGAQRAALVTGVGAGSRTAQDLIKDTLTKSNLDEMALRYNAAARAKSAMTGANMQAFNYESQARGDELTGANARRIAKSGQISTILGTAGDVASFWYRNSEYNFGNTRGRGIQAGESYKDYSGYA